METKMELATGAAQEQNQLRTTQAGSPFETAMKEKETPQIPLSDESSELKHNPQLLIHFYNYLATTKGLNHEDALNCANDLYKSFTGSLNITTTSYNLFDGMGDFISHVYFLSKLMEVYKENPNVSMQHFCFVEQKQVKNAESFLEQRFDKSLFTTASFEQKPDLNEIVNKKIIIVEYKTVKQLNNLHPEMREYLQNKFSKDDFIFNFSLPFDYITSMVPLKGSPKIIETWLEYGLRAKKGIDAQSTMGVSNDHLGIRIFDDITSRVQKPIADRILDLQSIENKEILGILTGKHNPSLDDLTQWANNDSLAFGYVKNNRNIKTLLLLSAAMKKSGNTSIIMDVDLIDLESDTFWNDFAALQYTHIEVYDHEGNKKTRQLTTSSAESRTLKLVPLKGVKHNDKIKLMTAPNIVLNAASGDTSISELISSGCSGEQEPAFPFIQPIFNPAGGSFKERFHQDLFDQCKVFATKNPHLKNEAIELVEYLELLLTKRIDDQALRFVQYTTNEKNKAPVLKIWKEFCHYIANERSIEKNVQEELILFTLLQLVQNNQFNELVELSSKMNTLEFHGQSFLHYALKLQKSDLFKVLFEEYLPNPSYFKIKELLTAPLMDNLIENASEQLKKSRTPHTWAILNILIDYFTQDLKGEIKKDVIDTMCLYNCNPVNLSLFPRAMLQNSTYLKQLLANYFVRGYLEDFEIILNNVQNNKDSVIVEVLDEILKNSNKGKCQPFLLLLLHHSSNEQTRLAIYEKTLFNYASGNNLKHLAPEILGQAKESSLLQKNIMNGLIARFSMNRELYDVKPIVDLFHPSNSSIISSIKNVINFCGSSIRANWKLFSGEGMPKECMNKLLFLIFKHSDSRNKLENELTLYFNKLSEGELAPELKTYFSQLKEMILVVYVNAMKKSDNFDEIRHSLVTKLSTYLNKVSPPMPADPRLFSKPILGNKETKEIQSLLKELNECTDLEDIKNKLQSFNGLKDPELRAILSSFERSFFSEARNTLL